MEQCSGTVEQSGETVKRCGGTVWWKSVVEQCGTVWNGIVQQWKTVVEQWKSVVEQCGTVWNSLVEQWNTVVEQCGETVEQCGTVWWEQWNSKTV